MKTQIDQSIEIAQKDIKDMEHNVGVYKEAITAYKNFQFFVQGYTTNREHLYKTFPLDPTMDLDLFLLSPFIKEIDESLEAVTKLGIGEDIIGFSPGHLARQFRNPQTIKLDNVLTAIDKGMENLQLAQKKAEELIAIRKHQIQSIKAFEQQSISKGKIENAKQALRDAKRTSLKQDIKASLAGETTALVSTLNGASEKLSVKELHEVFQEPDLRAKAIEAIQHDKKGEIVINDKMAEALFGITKESFKVEDYAKMYKEGGKEVSALDKALEAIKGKNVLEQLKADRKEFVKDNKGLQTARDKVGMKVEHVKEKFAEKFSRSSNDKDKSHAERVKSKQGAEKDSKGRV